MSSEIYSLMKERPIAERLTGTHATQLNRYLGDTVYMLSLERTDQIETKVKNRQWFVMHFVRMKCIHCNMMMKLFFPVFLKCLPFIFTHEIRIQIC